MALQSALVHFEALEVEDAMPALGARRNIVDMLSADTAVALLDLHHHVALPGTVVGHLDRLERKTAGMAEIHHNFVVDILGTMAERNCMAVLDAAKFVIGGTRVADTESEVELVHGILVEVDNV